MALVYFGAFIHDMKSDSVITEARARIIWGEPSSSVRSFLIESGISETEANARIKEFSSERNQEIRRIGIKDTCIGAALIGGGAVIVCLWIRRAHLGIGNSTGVGRGVGALILMVFYGIWKFIKGLFYLIRPQSEDQLHNRYNLSLTNLLTGVVLIESATGREQRAVVLYSSELPRPES
jgi:hypothetical protein